VVPCGLIHERAAGCAVTGAGARVTVRAGDGGPALDVVRAGRDGRFRVGVAPGTYVVEARAKGTPKQPAAPTVPATVPDGGWVSVVLPAGRMVAPAGRLGR
jgi:hypothetical protein